MAEIPDAAVQIADRALRFDAEYPEDRVEAAVAALDAAGWLHDPAEIAALRAVADAAWQCRKAQRWAEARDRRRDLFATLDALSRAGGAR